MNSVDNKNRANGEPVASGMGLDDVLFTLFRHKWLIVGSICLGIVGVLAVRVLRPPLFVSYAELMVHYVKETSKDVTSASEEQGTRTETVAQDILSSQSRIIRSLNVATNVANNVGSAKILAKYGGGDSQLSAAGVIASGIEVDSIPRTAILAVSFRHRDPDLVQPVLEQLINIYKKKHLEVYEGVGVLDEYYLRQRDDLRSKLGSTEEELKKLKSEAKIIFPEETKHSYQIHIAKVQDDLLDAQRQLAELKAVLGNVAPTALAQSTSNVTGASIPLDKLDDYTFAGTELETLKRRERELLQQYTAEWPQVKTLRDLIRKFTQQRAQLEGEFPALSQLSLGTVRGSTNSPGSNMAADMDELVRLNIRVPILGTMLSNLQYEAAIILDLEPKVARVQREHDEAQKTYDSVMSRLQRLLGADSGKTLGISIVQSPTPPGIDKKKFMKRIGMVFGGCLAMGLGLAFLMDLVLDRTIKRGSDVEKHLRLPVFLTIPDTSWTSRLRLPWGSKAAARSSPSAPTENGVADIAVAVWNPNLQLQTYADGLRERLMTYFDVNNMNLKKPKLVGVTGCGKGSGVSTLASSLAASLSKTGDGNVLLVDMNVEQGVAHSFYKGKPGCGLSDILEQDNRADAQVQENLFLASINENNKEKLTKPVPTRFTNLVPKLKASDYDYIIFDLPPASPTSSTPRLASHMDITLLVVEAEKTGQQVAARASRLMRESRANVAAVLNKYRPHVPARLSQEL